MRKIVKIVFLLLHVYVGLNAQSKKIVFPEIGKPLPNFAFNNMSDPNKSKIQLKDFDGKYLVLDFWSRGCGLCIQSFPKVNDIQQKYRDSLQVLLVGYLEKNGGLTVLFNKLKEKENLNLSVVYDSTYFNKVVPIGVPHLIWIDPTGIVKAITGTDDFTDDNVKKFISGKNFEFYDTSYQAMIDRQNMTQKKSKEIESVDTSLLCSSSLSIWKSEDEPYYQIPPRGKDHSFKLVGMSIKEMYSNAYLDVVNMVTDKIYWYPVLEVADTTKFDSSLAGKGRGMYTYQLFTNPKFAVGKELVKIMRSDLKKFFGYDAAIEEKMMPCIVLKVVDKNKTKLLMAKGNRKDSYWKNYMGGKLINWPLKDVALNLIGDLPHHPRIFDETNITTNVNLEIHTLTTDFESLRSAIQVYGLDLEKTKRLMKVLVIKDHS